MSAAEAPYVVVASLLKNDAMCVLFFTHLADRVPLRIVQYGRDNVAAPLSGASALVIIRGLFEFGNLAACARRLGVPVYYFIDDNFMLIRDEGGAGESSYERYTVDGVRDVLRDYAGVLLAAPSLVDYYAANRLHDRLHYYPPVMGPGLVALAREPSRPLTVAFFGGLHRRAPFLDYVYPAIRRLAATRPVRLVAAGLDPQTLEVDSRVQVVCPAYDRAYTAAIQAVAREGVDILVHPSHETGNNIFKNPHVIINARAIGAAAIFTNEAPYAALAGTGVALLTENSEAGWFQALSELTDAGRRDELRARADEYCRAHFSGAANEAIINDVMLAKPSPGDAARLARHVVGAAGMGWGHLVSRIEGRVARWRTRH